MKTTTASASGLQPHSSASMDRRQQPCLLPYNISLPSLHSQQHSLALKVVSLWQRLYTYLLTLRHFSFSNIFLTSLFASPSLSRLLILVVWHLKHLSPHFSPTSSSVCTEVRHIGGTSNGLLPCSQHSIQVHQSYLTAAIILKIYLFNDLSTTMFCSTGAS